MDLREKVKKLFGNKKVAVIGIGISNLPLIRFLLDAGADITARDIKPIEELSPEVKELCEERGLSVVCGDGYLDGIDEEVIFRSPGLRPDVDKIAEAVSSGSVLTSEMELFFALTPAKIVAVTGSDGKTTTTTLTYLLTKELLSHTGSRGRAFVGGNIGAPLLPHVYDMTDEDIAVVELSSFQLQNMSYAPSVAVITNITPNHLNWHIDMEEYTEAKKNIYKPEGCVRLVTNASNDITLGILKDTNKQGMKKIAFSSSVVKCEYSDGMVYLSDGNIILREGIFETVLLDASKIKLPGKHNIENYMAAAAAVYGLGFDEGAFVDVLREVAASFGGVEHRLEFVRTLEGVDYYNSSIDSSPTRTAAALRAFEDKSIVICGGYDKHIPFEPLAEVLCEKAKFVVLCGATAQAISAAIEKYEGYPKSGLSYVVEADFEAAVSRARDAATDGDRVILSPACASFDMFKNFEERGKKFKETVNSLK